jgi:hypothetical protein
MIHFTSAGAFLIVENSCAFVTIVPFVSLGAYKGRKLFFKDFYISASSISKAV